MASGAFEHTEIRRLEGAANAARAKALAAVALQSAAMRRARKTHRALCCAVLATVLAGAGCATAPPLPYDALADRAADGIEMDPPALRAALLSAPDFDQRLRQLALLERQVLALLADEPLRLGALGSAILDTYYGSLPGHLALARFYREVGAEAQAALHDTWVAAIRGAIEASGDGSEEAPYDVLSSTAARAFLSASDLDLVGATYGATPPDSAAGQPEELRLWTIAGPSGGPVRPAAFRLLHYPVLAAAVEADAATLLPLDRHETCASARLCDHFGARAFIHLLAVSGDDAAAATVGFNLLRGGRGDDGQRWLRQAARAGNAMANLGLAELYSERARRSSEERQATWLAAVEGEFLTAVEAGMDEAMLHLGRMYRSGLYGAAKQEQGIGLLQRAAALQNVQAQLVLAWLHVEGEGVAKDLDLAEEYFVAAASRDSQAKVQYARFLLHPPFERAFNERAWDWLRQLAAADNPRAMVLVGQLYARGVHVGKRLRRARGWFKRAAEAAPDDANLINEVAWTLTVSHLPRLRDERYALAIMERVMADETNAARRNPAYLDTWAATYAANGNFERAIAVQQEAIDLAVANDDPNGELAILREHLIAFRAGESISDETVP